MLLLVGLGNPGKEYSKNRHNIGFMVADEIVKHHCFGAYRSKFLGKISEGEIGSQRTLVLKPSTYVNRSGESIFEAMRFFKLKPEQLIVFHDELDLRAGKVRVKKGGGHGGHNGLRSIHSHVGEDYARVRLGIGHPGDKDKVVGYVLKDFSKLDQFWLQTMIKTISNEVHLLVRGCDSEFLNKISLALEPRSILASNEKVASNSSGSEALTKIDLES